MAGMDGPVDRAFLVSVEDLRDICDDLNDEKREYRLAYDAEKRVTLFYNDGPDNLNALCFTFPIVADLNINHASLVGLLGKQWPFGEDGLMVCLHVYTGKQVRHGIYLCEGELKQDSVEDWEKFWGPLEAALIKGMECPSR